MLAHLGQLRDWTVDMRSVWGQRMTVRDPETRERRRLRPEEKPENDAELWNQLVLYMEATINKATLIRDYALERQAEVEKGKQW